MLLTSRYTGIRFIRFTRKYRFQKEIALWFFAVFICSCAVAQPRTGYRDSLLAYQQNYIDTHDVVKNDDRKYIHFYPIDERYRLVASFKRIVDTTGIYMATSSGSRQKFFIYGLLTCRLRDTVIHLYVYQSPELAKQEKLKDYLFVPFEDATSGFESYGGGRYVEFYIYDIQNDKVTIDFNKAYNPYCAYAAGYNCPVPPKDNFLTVAIYAGEKNYGKPMH